MNDPAVIVSAGPRPHVTVLTLNRPAVRNAFGAELTGELLHVLTRVASNPSIRCVVITGAGKSFSSGADLRAVSAQSPEQNVEYNRAIRAVIGTVATMRVPVIAAINGAALGGGFELALACHLRVASEGAMLGLPEVRLGIIPAAGGIELLARTVSSGVAVRMLITGSTIDAGEAAELGLVDRVTPPGGSVEEALRLAEEIAAGAPLAVQAALALWRQLRAGEPDLTDQTDVELLRLLRSRDAVEGVAAVLDRREPDFKGE